MKTQLFEKQDIFPVKNKILAHFISYNRRWQTSWSNLCCFTLFSDKYCANDHFLGPKRLIETNISKNRFPRLQKILAPFSSYYRLLQTSGNTLEESIRFCDNHCWTYKINSLGPKRLLNINFFKKMLSSRWKNWPVLSRITEYGRPEVTFC